ncbi:MAG: hypothetical protein GDA43_03330 [Hormoscilla sp. SP5CHS1]|nr:hypothetical protein [Hormoscilla sp. SP12CHS1]MBC6452341.1 hypothetical protein [Hormoscilla sp. SP5CHS1]
MSTNYIAGNGEQGTENKKSPSMPNPGSEASPERSSFESACRIWGEVKTQAPQFATARLGLILFFQQILKFLLSEGLGVFDPSET